MTMTTPRHPRERAVLVTGAGGFIGHHLVKRLVAEGYWVRGADLKAPEFEPSAAHEFLRVDLREEAHCRAASEGVGMVFHLAADMGGIGYISSNFAAISRNNILMDAHMLEAARLQGVRRFFYSSTACVYPARLQRGEAAGGLREEDAIPADPEKGYGWEKLFAEQLCAYYREDHGLQTRVMRFHNVYGPLGTFEGGREKAPAAICRKVALTPDGGDVEVWGDGRQARSFCFVEDCVEGLLRVIESPYHEPLNLGSEELVTVDQLVDLVCEVAGKTLRKRHDLAAPQGVRGRNCDNALVRKVLDWEPSTPLRAGLARTYPWIEGQLRSAGRLP